MSVDHARLAPRAVTDDEVASYVEHGWVKLDRLWSAEAAGSVLTEIQRVMGADAGAADTTTVRHPILAARMIERHHGHHRLSIDPRTGDVLNPRLYEAGHSPQLGVAAARFLGGPARYLGEAALAKMPVDGETTGTLPTDWHHHAGADFDPTAWQPGPTPWAAVWTALCDLPAAAGTMRFVSPRDWRDPEVRQVLHDNREDPEPSYAWLEERGVLSPALDMRAGDAVVLGPYTYHSAPANRTAAPRWAYVVSVGLASEPYHGGVIPDAMYDGVEGLEVGKPYPDHRFPVLTAAEPVPA